LAFPYIAARAPALRHGRRIALLLRAWPFSVAPRPLALGATEKVLVLTSCRARGLCSHPRVPAPAKYMRSGSLRLGIGRRAPLWVLGVRRPMPPVANGFVIRRCGEGVGRRRLGGGSDDVRGGFSVAVLLDVIFACYASASFYYRLSTVISQTWR